jgi:hypothetical protein
MCRMGMMLGSTGMSAGYEASLNANRINKVQKEERILEEC